MWIQIWIRSQHFGLIADPDPVLDLGFGCSWDLREDGVAARVEEGGHGASVAVTAAAALCAAMDTAPTEMIE